MIILSPNGHRPEILDRVQKEGFKVFSEGDFNLNIIGERNPDGEADLFDDWLHIVYKHRGIWVWKVYACTVDAGAYYLKNYSRPSGTAILVHPQQMNGIYKIDLHGGKYEALCQRNGTVKVWRDNNKDLIHDMGGKEHSGNFGINIHRASINGSEYVGRYSAGCTVIKYPEDFDEFMSICKLQVSHNGWDKFTYTLIGGM